METSINEYFSRRRTVRRYSAKPVDAALVRNLLALAVHAPNTGNMQLYSAVVTSSPEMKRLIDTCLFAQQFNTLAEMNGLGCCYLGTTTYNAEEIGHLLSLPKLVVPVTTITVGWPDGEAPESDRLSPDAIIMDEKYRDFSPEDIKAIYSYKESLAESHRFVEENGKKNLAQVYAEIRYPRASAEIFSEKYLAYVKNQGFAI